MQRRLALEVWEAATQLAPFARSIKLGYALAKITAQLRDEHDASEKARLAWFETHAKKSEDGQRYTDFDPIALSEAMLPFMKEDVPIELYKIPSGVLDAEASYKPDAPLQYLAPLLAAGIVEE